MKAALFDEAGRQLRLVRVACPSVGEFDVTRWWSAAAEALRALEPADASALGICGRGGTNVILGPEGEVLAPSWEDRRASGHERQIRQEFGTSLTPRAAGLLAKSRWWSENEGALRWVCSAKDYVSFRLTGSFVSDAASGGSSSPAVPPLLPAAAPWALAGEAGPAASEAGLPPGLPIAVGWHDGAAATFGAGGAEAGCAVVTFGTNAVYRTVSRALPPSVPLYWDLTPGLTVTGGDITSAGRAHEWAHRLLTGDRAASPPGSNGVLFLPQVAGRFAPDLNLKARAGWHGLETRHSGADLLRAVGEGIGFSLRQVRDWLQAEGLPAIRTLATGGGARDPLQAQILADVLDTPIDVAGCEEGCRGAALLAAVASGHTTILEAAELRPAARRYLPSGAAGEYSLPYSRWLELQAATDGLGRPA